MNALRRFKIGDAIGQVLITPVAYIVTTIIDPSPHRTAATQLAACYFFGVGAWQATSCLIWALTTSGKLLQSSSRKVYSWLLLGLCVTGIPSFFGNSGDLAFFLLLALAVLAPAMSVWYFALTVVEASSLADNIQQP